MVFNEGQAFIDTPAWLAHSDLPVLAAWPASWAVQGVGLGHPVVGGTERPLHVHVVTQRGNTRNFKKMLIGCK